VKEIIQRYSEFLPVSSYVNDEAVNRSSPSIWSFDQGTGQRTNSTPSSYADITRTGTEQTPLLRAAISVEAAGPVPRPSST